MSRSKVLPVSKYNNHTPGAYLSTGKGDRLIRHDIKQCLPGIYMRGNSIIRNFKQCSEDVKYLLFKIYCNSLYGSQLWCNFTKDSFNQLRVAYNNTIFKVLMNMKKDASMSEQFIEHNVNHMHVLTGRLV